MVVGQFFEDIGEKVYNLIEVVCCAWLFSELFVFVDFDGWVG